jgi:hypothetical protein
MNDTLLNKNIIEAIRRAYAAPTPESTSAKTEERQGVMARTQSQVSSALEDTAQDALASVEGLIGKTMDARTDMEELSKQSAEENAQYRDSMGITASLKESDGAKPENTPLRLATQSAGLMSATKDGEVSAPMTAEAKSIVKAEIGIPSAMWDAYREEISAIESGGQENPYTTKGGANKHYDGMYQLGKVAKQDAADLLGITLGHTAQEREAYRNNPELQEKAFAAYTAKNHSYLMNKSEKYKMLPLKEKLAVLGYAHNQGWSGADTWLETGKTGKDAFGTKGTKYYDALIDRLNP